ncbi:MAG: hypothetical protein WDA16_06740 [Candidatus Thermoplasmatota archaeon]
MRVPILILTLLGSALAAGCATPPTSNVNAASIDPETGLPEWVVRGVPAGEDHDHDDPMQHLGLSTPNFHEVGWDPLITDRYGTSATGMGCGGTGVTKEGRKLALVHTIATEVSLIVADITDPAHPQKLGEYLMPNAVIWDATITPDGKHALVGAYPFALSGRGFVLPPNVPAGTFGAPSGQSFPFQLQFRDACTGETKNAGAEQYLPFGPGIVMIGLQDPKDPKFEDWVTQPAIGPHSVSAHAIDGHVYVSSSVTNLQHEASYYSFFEIMETPAGGKLVPLSVIEVPGHPGLTVLNGHTDVYLAKHPVTRKLTAWLANWDATYIYDMSDMKMPKQLSEWRDGNAGSVHSTLPLTDLRNGKHYTIVGQEVGEPKDLPSGWLYILDDTDPTKPQEVGRWTIPLKVPWRGANNSGGGLSFSPHYFAVQNDTLLVSNYHGGLWAVDISDITHPDAIGLFVPDKISPKPYGGKANGPGIEDVLIDPDTGIITVWGNGSGVYQLTFDAASPMVKPVAWQDAH